MPRTPTRTFEGPQMVQFQVALSRETRNRLAAHALEHDTTMKALVETALVEYLDREQTRGAPPDDPTLIADAFVQAKTHEYIVTYRTKGGQVKTKSIVSFHEQADMCARFVGLNPGITILTCEEHPSPVDRPS